MDYVNFLLLIMLNLLTQVVPNGLTNFKLVLNARKVLFSKDYTMAQQPVLQFQTNVRHMILLEVTVPLALKVMILLMAIVFSLRPITPSLLIQVVPNGIGINKFAFNALKDITSIAIKFVQFTVINVKQSVTVDYVFLVSKVMTQSKAIVPFQLPIQSNLQILVVLTGIGKANFVYSALKTGFLTQLEYVYLLAIFATLGMMLDNVSLALKVMIQLKELASFQPLTLLNLQIQDVPTGIGIIKFVLNALKASFLTPKKIVLPSATNVKLIILMDFVLNVLRDII